MCLIAYVPTGKEIPESYFRAAAHDNDDGIGVMSANGVEKFLGKKMVKRAWRHVRRLQDAQHAFAVHFRFATHGRVALVNTHPFKTPCGSAYVMHNGILSAYAPVDRNGDISDTRLLVETMSDVNVGGDTEYWDALEKHIGFGNKLCVMSHDGQFRIVNEYAGDWIDGVWYSQTYSLPSRGWETRYKSRYGGADLVSLGGRSYYVGCDNIYREMGTGYRPGENVALLPYERRSAAAAYERRDSDSAAGSGSHSLPSGTYYRDDDNALDAELARHFNDLEPLGEDEPTDICPACEHLHNEGRQCPVCGYIDMDDGMLSYSGTVAK
jgi:hypothetical protein